MSGSAETRISDGSTPTSAACSSVGVDLEAAAGELVGEHLANAGLRATWFSHSLLWDSWIDIDVPLPRFVRSSAGSIWRS